MVALTAVLTRPASATNLKMFRARSKTAAPPAKRVTRAAPTSASSVLPAAIPSDDRTEPAVVTLTRKAPAKITGQMPRPSSSRAASAMPVGGQTGVALACTMAKARPSLAATTYTTPTPSVTPSRAARSCIPLPSLRSGAALHRVGLPAGEAALVEHRRVHAAHRPSPAQHERDLLAHAAQPHGIEARGGRGDVRRQGDVVHLEQRIRRRDGLFLEHVEPGAGDPALLERLDQRRLVDGRTAPRVDE